MRLCEAASLSKARCSSLWQEPWGWRRGKIKLLSRRDRGKGEPGLGVRSGLRPYKESQGLEAGQGSVRRRAWLGSRGHWWEEQRDIKKRLLSQRAFKKKRAVK